MNPLSRLRRQLSRRESPWQRGQVSSLFVNGRKKPAVKQQTFRPCQSLSLSGEVARRSRDGEGCFRNEPSRSPTATASSPFCRLAATSSPGRGKSFEGRALGRTSKFRPHRSTAGRSLPLSSKLFALAKASPFRERWHGEAVTERVTSKTPSRRLQQEAAAYPLQTQKARRRVLQRAFDGSCGVAALSAAQQCLTPARPGPGWRNARSPSLPHGGCPRYGAWPPGSSLP